MKTRILITGASGFVGGSFCRRHAHRDDLEIRGLSRRPSDLPRYIRADLTRPLAIDWTPDVVIHAAARSSPWGSRKDFERQNVLATRHVIDFCEARGVRKLVYVSSSSVFYSESDQFDLTEESPIGPTFINTYAETKAAAEKLVRAYRGEWCILRPRAVFGAGDTVLFPRILRAAREGRMIRITRPGPPAIGDLIDIDSLSDYLLRAALDPAAVGDFNLTGGTPVEIQSFIADIFTQLGLPPVTRTVPLEKALRIADFLEGFHRSFMPWREPSLTRYGVGVLAWSKTFDITKARAALGPPSVSLDEAVRRFVEWQRART